MAPGTLRSAAALLLAAATLVTAHEDGGCIFDQIQRTLHGTHYGKARRLATETTQEYGRVADKHGRLLQGTTYSPIRIFADTSALDRNA